MMNYLMKINFNIINTQYQNPTQTQAQIQFP